jgi:hypothetical protein
MDQIVPPSVVATMPEALRFLPENVLQVASHMVVDGHETAVRAPTPPGRVGALHVVPPLVVARMAPTVVVPLNSDPTAVQSAVVAHDTADRLIGPVETVLPLQVAPPSVVVSTPAPEAVEPTAMHSDVDGHETPETSVAPLDRV